MNEKTILYVASASEECQFLHDNCDLSNCKVINVTFNEEGRNELQSELGKIIIPALKKGDKFIIDKNKIEKELGLKSFVLRKINTFR